MAAQLQWLVNLGTPVCDMNWWLSCKVSALQSVVAGSISSDGGYVIHSWWYLIRSKHLLSVPVYRGLFFSGFSGRGNSTHNNSSVSEDEKTNQNTLDATKYFKINSKILYLEKRQGNLNDRKIKNLWSNIWKRLYIKKENDGKGLIELESTNKTTTIRLRKYVDTTID